MDKHGRVVLGRAEGLALPSEVTLCGMMEDWRLRRACCLDLCTSNEYREKCTMEEDITNVLVAGAATLAESQASSSSLVIPPQLRKEVQILNCPHIFSVPLIRNSRHHKSTCLNPRKSLSLSASQATRYCFVKILLLQTEIIGTNTSIIGGIRRRCLPQASRLVDPRYHSQHHFSQSPGVVLKRYRDGVRRPQQHQ